MYWIWRILENHIHNQWQIFTSYICDAWRNECSHCFSIAHLECSPMHVYAEHESCWIPWGLLPKSVCTGLCSQLHSTIRTFLLLESWASLYIQHNHVKKLFLNSNFGLKGRVVFLKAASFNLILILNSYLVKKLAHQRDDFNLIFCLSCSLPMFREGFFLVEREHSNIIFFSVSLSLCWKVG